MKFISYFKDFSSGKLLEKIIFQQKNIFTYVTQFYLSLFFSNVLKFGMNLTAALYYVKFKES